MKILIMLFLLSRLPAELSAGYSEKVLDMHQQLSFDKNLFQKSCKPSELPKIERAIEKYCISPDLCRAVILVESGCDSKAKSKTGDYGLMQVNQVHGIYTGIEENIKAGAEILEANLWIMLKEFAFELHEALKRGLQAYNSGITATKKQIFKERSEAEQRELFYCNQNFHCYLEKN